MRAEQLGCGQRDGPQADWWRENLPLILLTFAAGVLVFLPVLLYNLQNPDSTWMGSLYIADHIGAEGWEYLNFWETRQGRWALTLVDSLRGGINDSAVLTRLPALLFFAIGAQLAADLLALRGRMARILAPLALVLNPCVFEILTYRYCCASYGLSYLLAVAAVAAVVRLPGLPGIAAGALCLAFSLGLYQASLAVAVVLCLMLGILALLRHPADWRTVPRRLGRMLAMGAAGVAAYCAALFAVLAYHGESLTFYNGANNFGALHILLALPAGLVKACRDTLVFYFGQGIAANHYGMRYAYAVLLAAGLAAGAYLLWRGAAALRAAGVALAVLLAVLLLPAMNCMGIIIPESSATPRASLALLLAVPFALALGEAGGLPQALRRAAPTVLCAATAGLLWACTLQSITNAQVMTLRKNLYKTVAAQVYTDLAKAEGYGSLPVLVVGQLPNGAYPDPAAALADYADTVAGSKFSWDKLRYTNLACWQNLYREELGLQLNWCTLAQAYAIQDSAAFAAMPDYPAAGAIGTLSVDGEEFLVVKVSEA